MKYIKTTSLLFFCFIASFSRSQGEFLIEIDTATGSYHQVGGAISGIMWVSPYIRAYDETHGAYIFQGGNPLVDHLYSIDVTNGSILSNPYFPPSGSATSVTEPKYDNTKDTVYGAYWDNASHQFFFASVNTTTGINTLVSTTPIAGLTGIVQGGSAYDEVNHHYLLLRNNQLFSIDASSGILLSSPLLNLLPGEQLLHFCYNNSTNTLNGLIQNSGTGTSYLASINTSSGAVTSIGSGIALAPGGGSVSIDQLHQRYMYTYTSAGNYRIVSMDINTGNLISDNFIPLGSGDNIHSIAFDNVKGKLYAIQWDALTTGVEELHHEGAINIYPIPAINSITIQSPAELGLITIYNALGEMVLQLKSKNKQEQIDIDKLSVGIYFLQAQGKYNKIIKE